MADITAPVGELVVGGSAPFPAVAVHDKSSGFNFDGFFTKIALVGCKMQLA